MNALEPTLTDSQAAQVNLPQLLADLSDTQKHLQATQKQLQVSQAQLQDTRQQLEDALKRIEELEKKLGTSPTARLDKPYSMSAEEKRRQAQGLGKPKSRGGRRPHDDKMELVGRTESIYPDGVNPEQCRFTHTRLVWRWEEGRTVLVAYRMHCGPKRQYGIIPGVIGRSEFGSEIIVAVAHMTYTMRLSLDQVCSVLGFLKDLSIGKSQAEALLKQLARHWEREFDTLCLLIANSAIVHADETGWSLNSVWAFLSEQARVLLFGVNKDAATLKLILDSDLFKGILFSDDAAVYANFTRMQKCWAHLIRKAIKLTLQDDKDPRYLRLLDGLLAIYRTARTIQMDATLDEAAKLAHVTQLEDELDRLCYGEELPEARQGLEHDYALLAHEVIRLKDNKSLFTFVTAVPPEQPNGAALPVDGTNNEAERTLRGAAEARKTCRTNKTAAGARRRTIIVSVLESLRLYLRRYTLQTVTAEMQRWLQRGRSCFAEQLAKLERELPEKSILDRLYPKPQPSG